MFLYHTPFFHCLLQMVDATLPPFFIATCYSLIGCKTSVAIFIWSTAISVWLVQGRKVEMLTLSSFFFFFSRLSSESGTAEATCGGVSKTICQHPTITSNHARSARWQSHHTNLRNGDSESARWHESTLLSTGGESGESELGLIGTVDVSYPTAELTACSGLPFAFLTPSVACKDTLR